MRRFLWIVLFLLPAAAADQRLTIENVRTMAFGKRVVTLTESELDHGIWEVR